MKFLVFNVVVAAALIYLVADKDSDFRAALPTLDGISGTVEQAAERLAPQANPEPAAVDAPTIADADLVDAAAEDAPNREPASAPQVVENLPPLVPPVIEVPVRQVHTVTPPPAAQPAAEPAAIPAVEPAVVQRRAEVLGTAPAGTGEALSQPAERRRQLLDLAEEMEYLAAEFAVR